MATQKEIARKAGVSQCTVSYVLSGTANCSISKETAKKILSLAGKMQYKKRFVPARENRSSIRNIGHFIPPIIADCANDPYYARFISGLKKEQPTNKKECEIADKEIRRKTEAIKRYQVAFERNTMPESVCGERIRELGAEIEQIGERKADLTVKMQNNSIPLISKKRFVETLNKIDDILLSHPDQEKKTLVKNLVKEIRVKGPDYIEPTYFIPAVLIVDSEVGHWRLGTARLPLRLGSDISATRHWRTLR